MNSVKCPQCGLVNWSTTQECKRCHALIGADRETGDYQDVSTRYSLEKEVQVEPLFSGLVVYLTVFLAFAVAMFLVQQIFGLFSPDTAKVVAVFFFLPGLVLYLVTHIWLLLRIFDQSVGWGLASLFIPIVMLIAVAQFWHKTKRSFVGQFICAAIVIVGGAIGFN